ncbi:hypothetical protein L1049_015861 [Liquidambar formosana]|uniref:EF-hand domain-containing protein n=1 Tax=Liquidambar formosana TaxID=63359 RepID=A0AAP0X2D2_LIQFO
MVREIDKDGNRLIDLYAFTKLNTNGFNSHEVMENLKYVFTVYELDGNGSTLADELHEVWSNLGDKCSLAECENHFIVGQKIKCNARVRYLEYIYMGRVPLTPSVTAVGLKTQFYTLLILH